MWLLPSVHQLFEDCSHTHYPWDTPTDKNLGSSSLVNALCGSSDEVLGIIGTTQRYRSRWRIVLIHIILEIPPQIKIWGGVKAGECAAHSISHFLLISLSLNRSLSQARESFVVWGVAPNLPEPLFISIYTSASSQWCPKLHQVYENNPQTIGELKTAITAKIREIPKEECVRVIDNFARRMQVCLQRRGCHLEHILERT
jgi:hypothetical protein